MYARRRTFAQRLLGVVDLAIDFATLGEYGLEPGEPAVASAFPADGPCRERAGHPTGWEALARPTAGIRRPSHRGGADCRADSNVEPFAAQ